MIDKLTPTSQQFWRLGSGKVSDAALIWLVDPRDMDKPKNKDQNEIMRQAASDLGASKIYLRSFGHKSSRLQDYCASNFRVTQDNHITVFIYIEAEEQMKHGDLFYRRVEKTQTWEQIHDRMDVGGKAIELWDYPLRVKSKPTDGGDRLREIQEIGGRKIWADEPYLKKKGISWEEHRLTTDHLRWDTEARNASRKATHERRMAEKKAKMLKAAERERAEEDAARARSTGAEILADNLSSLDFHNSIEGIYYLPAIQLLANPNIGQPFPRKARKFLGVDMGTHTIQFGPQCVQKPIAAGPSHTLSRTISIPRLGLEITSDTSGKYIQNSAIVKPVFPLTARERAARANRPTPQHKSEKVRAKSV